MIVFFWGVAGISGWPNITCSCLGGGKHSIIINGYRCCSENNLRVSILYIKIYNLSMITLEAPPPPLQMAARPLSPALPSCSKTDNRVTITLAPEHPNG